MNALLRALTTPSPAEHWRMQFLAAQAAIAELARKLEGRCDLIARQREQIEKRDLRISILEAEISARSAAAEEHHRRRAELEAELEIERDRYQSLAADFAASLDECNREHVRPETREQVFGRDC